MFDGVPVFIYIIYIYIYACALIYCIHNLRYYIISPPHFLISHCSIHIPFEKLNLLVI